MDPINTVPNGTTPSCNKRSMSSRGTPARSKGTMSALKRPPLMRGSSRLQNGSSHCVYWLTPASPPTTRNWYCGGSAARPTDCRPQARTSAAHGALRTEKICCWMDIPRPPLWRLCCTMAPSMDARIGAPIGQPVLAGNVARMHAAQKGADRAKFPRCAQAPRRNGRGVRGPHLLQAAAGARGLSGKGGGEAVGVELARQEVVDRDPARRQRAARHTSDKPREAAARSVGQTQDVDGRLDGAGGDVDDAPKPALGHAVHGGTDQLDRRQHVGVQRLQPGLTLPVAKIHWRRPGGVGHNDVKGLARPARCRENGLAALRRGDVCGHAQHLRFRMFYGSSALRISANSY